MTSRHLIDPETIAALEELLNLQLNPETLPFIRTGLVELLTVQDSGLPVRVETLSVPGPEGAPPVRLLHYRPLDSAATLPAIFHIHGGGYVLGTPEMMDAGNRALALELGCAILSVDYRLAPETVFPGAIEDCYAGLAWVVNNAAALEIDAGRIGLMGESAGGGLAAALALLVRDRGEFPIAFQHLIYPMLDDRSTASTHPYTGEFGWTRGNNHFGWSSLLGQPPGGAGISPYAAAARAGNLAGLPPSFIMVGALDLFLEENMDYALRLTRAGVPAELHVYPGGLHGFDRAETARIAIAARNASREALRRALHG